jgi:hypothetical protein
MKTNWPDDKINRVLSTRNPEPGNALTGSESSPEACALLSRLLAIDPNAQPGAQEPPQGRAAKRRVANAGHRVSARFPKRPLPRLAVVGLAAAALAAVLASIGINSRGIPPTAAAVLEHTAQVAEEQPAIAPPGPGQYYYSRSILQNLFAVSNVPSVVGLQTQVQRLWVGPDGSGRITQVNQGTPSFLAPEDKAKWVAAGSLTLGDPHIDQTFGAGKLPFVDFSTLPTDPAALAKLVREGRVGPSGLVPVGENPALSPATELGHITGSLINEGYASPAMRSALYQVIAGIPGMKLLGAVTDGIGRTGTAVALTDGQSGEQIVLIFDPNTSAILEVKALAVGPNRLIGSSVGTVVSSTIFVSSGVVASNTAVPPSAGTTGSWVGH